jgi:hypothetical protein
VLYVTHFASISVKVGEFIDAIEIDRLSKFHHPMSCILCAARHMKVLKKLHFGDITWMRNYSKFCSVQATGLMWSLYAR